MQRIQITCRHCRGPVIQCRQVTSARRAFGGFVVTVNGKCDQCGKHSSSKVRVADPDDVHS